MTCYFPKKAPLRNIAKNFGCNLPPSRQVSTDRYLFATTTSLNGLFLSSFNLLFMAIKEKNLTETVCIYTYKSRRSLHSKRPWRNFFRDFHTFQMTSTTRNFCLGRDRKLKLEKKKKCDMYDQFFFFLQWIIICILYTIDELVLAEL